MNKRTWQAFVSSKIKLPKKPEKRILLITTGGLGDAILFSPVIKALKNVGPNHHIEMLAANPLVYEIYQFSENIYNIRIVPTRKSSPILNAFRILLIAAKYRKSGGFDIGIFATGLDKRFGKLLKYLGCVKNVEFAPSYPDYETDIECNISLACKFKANTSEEDAFVPLTERHILEAKRISEKNGIFMDSQKIIAIYASQELQHRPRWQLENLLHVIERLKIWGVKGKFVVVGSAKEGKQWGEIDSKGIVDANLAGKLSISGSAAFLKKCSLLIGNDGGLMHVGGAVGCPLVVIMANTPFSYRPPGENTIVIHSKLSCCDGFYPKRPRNCKAPRCAEDITVEEVFSACKGLIERNSVIKEW